MSACSQCGNRPAEINDWCFDCIQLWQEYENEKGT